VDHPPTLPPSINRYNIDKPVLYIVMGSIQHYTNNDKQKLLIEKTPIAIKNAVKKYYE